MLAKPPANLFHLRHSKIMNIPYIFSVLNEMLHQTNNFSYGFIELLVETLDISHINKDMIEIYSS